MSFQTTLRAPVSCTGIGLHSGAPVILALHPAAAGHGIVFRRLDVDRKISLIPARWDLVNETRLGTTLTNARGVSVATVEHLMAALWGAGVDNALITLDGPEIPIMDGSSEPFMALLAQAGIRALAAPREVIRVVKEVEVSDGASLARVQPYGGEDFGCSLDIEIDFPHPAIAHSRAFYDFSEDSFAASLAAARTFGFAHEVAQLRKIGLARGGSLENAIVLGEEGVLNEGGLRFADEFVRHKALDCVGDLFLAGLRIEGHFTFRRPGHAVNNRLLRALMADKSAWKRVCTLPAPKAAEGSAHAEAAAFL